MNVEKSDQDAKMRKAFFEHVTGKTAGMPGMIASVIECNYLAWQAWQAATTTERERCALACEARRDEHAHGPNWNSRRAAEAQECADIIRRGA